MIVNFNIDLPDDLFDAQFTESVFAPRVRELAILELVRLKRLHEHEAKEMLSLERHELDDSGKVASRINHGGYWDDTGSWVDTGPFDGA